MRSPDDLLRTIDGGRVLDAGCGAGYFTRRLAGSLRSYESIIGIDPDKDSLDEARRQTDDPDVRYRQMSVLDLEADPPRFDTVAISNALHHVEDPSQVLRRLVSVLRPGGTLVVNELYCDDLNRLQAIGRDVHHFKAACDELQGRVHRPTFTRQEIRDLVASAGGPTTDASPLVSIEAECIGQFEPAGAGDQAAREAIDFLEEYVGFVRGLPSGEDMLSRMREIQGRTRAEGIQSAPTLCLIARRSGASVRPVAQ